MKFFVNLLVSFILASILSSILCAVFILTEFAPAKDGAAVSLVSGLLFTFLIYKKRVKQGKFTEKVKKKDFDGMTQKEKIVAERTKEYEELDSRKLNLKKDSFEDIENGGTFETTIKIGTYFKYDKTNNKIMLIHPEGAFKKYYSIYNLSDILEFEYIENDKSEIKGGLGRALVGGALFGGVGAIVGGVTGGKKQIQTITDMRIKFVIKSSIPKIDYLKINLFNVKNNSHQYMELTEQLHQILSILTHNSKQDEVVEPKKNDINELREFKKLFDEGIITEEEFQNKKKELLN